MPHQCTNCGRRFADGSKEMLSGCPDCGGNKFQFSPAGTDRDDEPAPEADAEAPTDDRGAVSRAASTVRRWMSDDAPVDRDATAESQTRSSGGASASTPTEPSTAEDGSPTSTQSVPTAKAASDDRTGDSLTEDFPEWPDTAREPADRSGSDGDSPTGAANSSRTADVAAGSSDADRPTSGPDETPPTSSPDETSPTSGTEPGHPDVDGDERSPEDPIGTSSEDTAQASARSEVVSSADLPPPGDTTPTASVPTDDEDGPPEHGRVVSEPSEERPSLDELREELNDQFESIKIVQPGQYELNLMELYDREEYIVSLQEDGRYVIDVPDSWREGADDEAA